MKGRVGSIGEDWLSRAAAASDAGDVRAARGLALRGLDEAPADPRLLRLAGQASLDLDLPDAVDFLSRLVDVSPDDARAWRDLGLALVDEGELSHAERALRRSLEQDASDPAVLVALAHVSHALGQRREALDLLQRAAPADLAALRSLIDMQRAAGLTQAALDSAEELARRRPDDVLALLDVAELSLELGRFEAAHAAFERLRTVDGEPGHGVYACHGLVEVEVRRERWRSALDAAIDATTLDRHHLTTDLLAFVTAKLFGDGDRPAPEWDELRAQLQDERSGHRRLHEEALVDMTRPVP